MQKLVEQYPLEIHGKWSPNGGPYNTMYDNRSAQINYAIIRHFKPKIVVEFGANLGRCTHDILLAMLDNGGGLLQSYELDENKRLIAEGLLNDIFGKKIKLGGDITKAKDIPNNIDYLFIDNDHDMKITKWVFKTLIKKCRPGAIVAIHDLPLKGDFQKGKDGGFEETEYIIKLHNQGKLPLEKLYWTWEENGGGESTWWTYRPLSLAGTK